MNNSPDMMTAAMNMFLALAIVLAILLTLFYLFKKLVKKDYSNSGNSLIKILDSSFIGVKKRIALVEVPGAVLVLGITNNNISFLTRINKEDVAQEMQVTGSALPKSGFAEKLINIISKKKM